MLRSGLLLCASLFANLGLFLLPFVDFVSIAWSAPVLLTAFSVWLLGEKVGWTAWVSVLIGMLGVLVIVRPTGAGFSFFMLVPLLAAVSNALYQITTRVLRLSDSPVTTIFYTGFAGMIICSAILPFVGKVPTTRDGAVMVLLGLIGGASQFCQVRAFSAAPAAVLAPFGYTSLLWAALVSTLFFSEFPSPTTLIGAALIVLGGLFTFLRERKN
jgi:drug/metabolite transporter (DMT)-like permease